MNGNKITSSNNALSGASMRDSFISLISKFSYLINEY